MPYDLSSAKMALPPRNTVTFPEEEDTTTAKAEVSAEMAAANHPLAGEDVIFDITLVAVG